MCPVALRGHAVPLREESFHAQVHSRICVRHVLRCHAARGHDCGSFGSRWPRKKYRSSLSRPRPSTFFFRSMRGAIRSTPARVTPAQFTWTLKAPDARLFDQKGKPFGKHFAGPCVGSERRQPRYRQGRRQFAIAGRQFRSMAARHDRQPRWQRRALSRDKHSARQYQGWQSAGVGLRRVARRPGSPCGVFR